MGRKPKNGEGTAQLRKDGLPKTKNVLAKTKGECVDKLKTLKDTIAPANPSKVQGRYAIWGVSELLVRNLQQTINPAQNPSNLRRVSPAIHQTKARRYSTEQTNRK